MWMLTPKNYEPIRRLFPPGSGRWELLRFFYSFVSVPVYCVYPVLLLLLWRTGDARLWRVLLVPAATFAVCTLLRAKLNWPRPYDQPDFEPLLPKTGAGGAPGSTPDGANGPAGQSCPSRHAASAGIITLAGWYTSPALGGMLTVLCALICLVRVLAGVHHPRDIAAGLGLAALFGAVGFWLL